MYLNWMNGPTLVVYNSNNKDSYVQFIPIAATDYLKYTTHIIDERDWIPLRYLFVSLHFKNTGGGVLSA